MYVVDRGVLVRGSRCSIGGGRGGLGFFDIFFGDFVIWVSIFEVFD